jgi:hypothetical protein
MDEFFQRLYLDEIDKQCGHARRALTALERLVSDRCNDHQGVFFFIQALMGHVAAISRVLWPPSTSGGRCQTRGEELRSLLDIPDNHSIRSRDLRNHLEHYDERLDAWIQDSEHHNVAVDFIGPPGVFGGPNMSQRDVFRQFDPGSSSVYFGERSYDIEEISSGIQDIQNRIEKWRRRDNA